MRKTLARLDMRHFLVSRAKIQQEVLFEEQLSVPLISLDSMCVYEKHPHAFNAAIGELLRLFKEIHFRDLLVETLHPTDDFPLAVFVMNRWVFSR
jgi:hypothetical protein